MEAVKKAAEKTAPKNSEKIKVLAWGDYCCATGFGTVMSNVMQRLEATGKYEIDVIGINYSGDPYDAKRWPGRVFPAMPGIMGQAGPYADVYGRQRLLDMAGRGDYDVIFMLQDTFVLHTMLPVLKQTQVALAKIEGAKIFKTVFYFPIDATPKKEWATEVVAQVDFPVAYCLYGRTEIARFVPGLANIPYIYHGTNLEDFYPIEDREAVAEFRKEYWPVIEPDRFLMVNVNRNQPRKDVVRSLMILAELKKRGRKPFLYLHMQHSDIGGNIFVMADQLGLENEKDFILPNPALFNANQGLPIDKLNLIYNAADMVLTTTLGEGWGLSITEAFATKTPIVGPNNTSLSEIMAEGRGALVPSGADPSMWRMDIQDNERIRPIMDVEAAADAIEKIMNAKGNMEASTDTPDTEAAYEWAKKYSWDAVCAYWLQIIEGAAAASKAANNTNTATQHMNRAERRAFERKQAKKAPNAAV